MGPIRGDAKKFALERAADYIARFGIPDGMDPGEETDAKFKEVCFFFVVTYELCDKRGCLLWYLAWG